MENIEEKSNNELKLMIKHFEMEHEALKQSMVKDYDAIVALKERIKTNWNKLEQVESDCATTINLLVKRLKGEI